MPPRAPISKTVQVLRLLPALLMLQIKYQVLQEHTEESAENFHLLIAKLRYHVRLRVHMHESSWSTDSVRTSDEYNTLSGTVSLISAL